MSPDVLSACQQAAGRVLLACVDKALYAKLFGGLFIGTLKDWTGAAQGVAASRLSGWLSESLLF